MQSALRHGDSHAQLAVAIDGWADAIRPYRLRVHLSTEITLGHKPDFSKKSGLSQH
jgi:hypothetical protein